MKLWRLPKTSKEDKQYYTVTNDKETTVVVIACGNDGVRTEVTAKMLETSAYGSWLPGEVKLPKGSELVECGHGVIFRKWRVLVKYFVPMLIQQESELRC